MVFLVRANVDEAVTFVWVPVDRDCINKKMSVKERSSDYCLAFLYKTSKRATSMTFPHFCSFKHLKQCSSLSTQDTIYQLEKINRSLFKPSSLHNLFPLFLMVYQRIGFLFQLLSLATEHRYMHRSARWLDQYRILISLLAQLFGFHLKFLIRTIFLRQANKYRYIYKAKPVCFCLHSEVWLLSRDCTLRQAQWGSLFYSLWYAWSSYSLQSLRAISGVASSAGKY